jgi:hypothetical protein
MAEIKSFASDALWVVIDGAGTALNSPEHRRWYAGVAVYLVVAFLMGNALSEMWNIYVQSMV